MDLINKDKIWEYLPKIYENDQEPFKLQNIGYYVYTKTERANSFQSKSFKRIIHLDSSIDYCIEYVFYWNYDSEHMYDLEHIWIFVGYFGEILDCEVSFHGKYLKGILPTQQQSNDKITKGKEIEIYCQPGKHAFSPITDIFLLWPRYYSASSHDIGKGGLLVTELMKGRISKDEGIDKMVQKYMEKFRFMPAETYHELKRTKDQLMPLDILIDNIPEKIVCELAKIEKIINPHKFKNSHN